MTSSTITLGDILRRIEDDPESGSLGPLSHSGHLSNCIHGRSVPCTWCDWAVITNDVRHLLAVLEDAELVLASPPSGLIWALAAWSIAHVHTSIDHHGLRPEALQVVVSLCDEVRRKQRLVQSLLIRECETGGPLEACIRRMAALDSIAAVASSPRRWHQFLEPSLQHEISQLSRRVDPERLQMLITSEREALLESECLPFRTVPELSALDLRRNKVQHAVFAGIPKGSFKELALGAGLSETTEAVRRIANTIQCSSVMITVTISPEIILNLKTLRRSLWTQCSIDWTHTFIDIAEAPCWRFSENVPEILTVPWFVFAALSRSEDAGFLPAIAQRRDIRQLDPVPRF